MVLLENLNQILMLKRQGKCDNISLWRDDLWILNRKSWQGNKWSIIAARLQEVLCTSSPIHQYKSKKLYYGMYIAGEVLSKI